MTDVGSATALRGDLLELVCRHVRFASRAVEWAEVRLADLGLDSMSAIDLVLDIEENLGVEFPDELLVAETFETAMSLQAVVTSLEGDRA